MQNNIDIQFILENFEFLFEKITKIQEDENNINFFIIPKQKIFYEIIERNIITEDNFYHNNKYSYFFKNINKQINFIIENNSIILNEKIENIIKIFAKSLGYNYNKNGLSYKYIDENKKINYLFVTNDINEIMNILDLNYKLINENNNDFNIVKMITSSKRYDFKLFFEAVNSCKIKINEIYDLLYNIRKIKKQADEYPKFYWENKYLSYNFNNYLSNYKKSNNIINKINNISINEWISEILETNNNIIIENAKKYINSRWGSYNNIKNSKIISDIIKWQMNN